MYSSFFISDWRRRQSWKRRNKIVHFVIVGRATQKPRCLRPLWGTNVGLWSLSSRWWYILSQSTQACQRLHWGKFCFQTIHHSHVLHVHMSNATFTTTIPFIVFFSICLTKLQFYLFCGWLYEHQTLSLFTWANLPVFNFVGSKKV